MKSATALGFAVVSATLVFAMLAAGALVSLSALQATEYDQSGCCRAAHVTRWVTLTRPETP